MSNYFTCLDIISRQIGGVYVDRSFVGQKTNKKPLELINIIAQYVDELYQRVICLKSKSIVTIEILMFFRLPNV